MSLRERLTLFIATILVLFSINVGTDSWGNKKRKIQIHDLRQAVLGQLQATEFKQDLENLRKAILLLSSLRSNLQENLTKQEVNQALNEISSLSNRIHYFRPPLTNADNYRNFFNSFVDLMPMWQRFYRNYNNPQYSHYVEDDKREMLYLRLIGSHEAIEKELVEIADKKSSEIDDTEKLTNQITIVVFILSIILTIGMGLFLINYTNRELFKLKKGASIIGGGNLDHRIPITSRDELGKVGESFNKMAAQLNLAINESNRTREVADQANRSKSIFLANMSHELRTPLNAIIGYSEMMLEDMEMGELDEREQRSDLGKILYAGRHLLSQINDVLDFSKIETGNMTVYKEVFDPIAVLEGLMNTLSPLAKKRNNALSFESSGNMPPLFNDVTKFRQIFYNLLSNSCKFTNNGKIVVRADYDSVKSPFVARFKVIDTGIGMTKEQLKVVFDAFIQADSSTTRKYGGTGLGLALCKQYSELMAGAITVESEVNIGTIFTIEFKIDEEKINKLDIKQEDTELQLIADFIMPNDHAIEKIEPLINTDLEKKNKK